MTLDRAGRRRCLGIGAGVLALGAGGLVRTHASTVPRSSQGLRPALNVGPTRSIQTLKDAASIARDGDVVLVDAAEYRGDVAVWSQRQLVIRGVSDPQGAPPKVIADGASAEGKGIFVIRGDDVRVENIVFTGSRVRERNGAGIRHERGRLTVYRCRFEDNENGILTANEPTLELYVLESTFIGNGSGDGFSHNLYAGSISRLEVTGSYFARTRVGHLLKSRARNTVVQYSRLSAEDGTSSYELDLPAGGEALIIGNMIQQGRTTENSTLVSFGAEGYAWPRNELLMAFNTLINDRPQGGVFVSARAGNAEARLMHNLLVGRATVEVRSPLTSIGNVEAAAKSFAAASDFDYRLRLNAREVGGAGSYGSIEPRLRPTRSYVHPARSSALEAMTVLTPLSPGAFQQLAP